MNNDFSIGIVTWNHIDVFELFVNMGIAMVGTLAKVLDSNITASDFELNLRNYVHFWTKTLAVV